MDVGAFTDGDVSTEAEYDAVMGDCEPATRTRSSTTWLARSSLRTAWTRPRSSASAGPCAIDPAQGLILSGSAVMNGLFQDGQEVPPEDLDDRGVQRDLHPRVRTLLGPRSFAGQRRLRLGVLRPWRRRIRRPADDVPLPRDYAQGSLSIDDVAWISKLYPAAGASGFAATHGTITGRVFFSDGESHAQLVNVVARRVDNGSAAPTRAAHWPSPASPATGSASSAATRSTSPTDQPLGPFGNQVATDIGFFEISLPPGNYMIEVESIDPAFVEGSSVGGDDRIDMPGTAPPPTVPSRHGRGESAGNDVTLIGTPPRFDQFEGP